MSWDPRSTLQRLLGGPFGESVTYGATSFRGLVARMGTRDGAALPAHVWASATGPAMSVDKGDTLTIDSTALEVVGVDYDGHHVVRIKLEPQIRTS